MNPTLALTCGDPAGIGPEIAVKCLANLEILSTCRLVVVGDAEQLRQTASSLRLSLPQSLQVWDSRSTLEGAGPFLVDLGASFEPIAPGIPSAASGQSAMAAIKKAVSLAWERKVDGIVTGPISKKALHLAGAGATGHTEILARLTDSPQVGMMFVTPAFKVVVLSHHVSLRNALDLITRDRLAGLIRFAASEHRRLFREEPRMGVAGLNPHAGEDSLFGDEEEKEIAPAIERCREEGLDVWGPYPPDTIYLRATRKEFNLVVALYHDQATIPVKASAFGKSAGLTLGLPFLRTTVDHGTAFDIAGRGTADPSSLKAAIDLAVRLTANRSSGSSGSLRLGPSDGSLEPSFEESEPLPPGQQE
ncbi:MAG: 4-hydroxythreonine-4-phosphate dehydrogenase PdxA [Acidobacteria bacterium]|nr:4-hydroxythreonine-4-phosphate dehydrogenase PdxA [Acidobacteriota bacterium]